TSSTSSTSSTYSTSSISSISSTCDRTGAGRGTVMVCLHAGHEPCLPASSSLTLSPAPHFRHLNLMVISRTPPGWFSPLSEGFRLRKVREQPDVLEDIQGEAARTLSDPMA